MSKLENQVIKAAGTFLLYEKVEDGKKRMYIFFGCESRLGVKVWSECGGKLESWEDFKGAAYRETIEETDFVGSKGWIISEEDVQNAEEKGLYLDFKKDEKIYNKTVEYRLYFIKIEKYFDIESFNNEEKGSENGKVGYRYFPIEDVLNHENGVMKGGYLLYENDVERLDEIKGMIERCLGCSL